MSQARRRHFLITAGALFAPPQTIHYQGYLTNAAGAPLSGSQSVTFRLYSVPSDGTALWAETQSVNAANGNFSALLGNVTPFGLPFDAQYYLGITACTLLR